MDEYSRGPTVSQMYKLFVVSCNEGEFGNLGNRRGVALVVCEPDTKTLIPYVILVTKPSFISK